MSQEEPEKQYGEIDEELRPFSVLLEGLADIQEPAMNVEQVKLDVPYEIEVIDEDGKLTLGSAPPTQPIETTFMPVINRMRVTITQVDKLNGE